jgi:hypothetical protein
VEAVVIERDAVPGGSTALATGLLLAAATRFQRAKDVAESSSCAEPRSRGAAL